jgi:hypothetical protein
MANKPFIACRPWQATSSDGHLRITGWRREPTVGGIPGVYIGSREMTFCVGKSLAIRGKFVAMRRSKRPIRDAAAGWVDPIAAYEGWLRERLADILGFANLERLVIDRYSSKQVLRKFDHRRDHTRVRSETIAEVEATLHIKVKNPSELEAWMLKGVGPQKAFGYGAFLPVVYASEIT